MAGYVWSINDVAWTKDVPPLAVAKGERVELVIVNQTPMPHPMHLHGHEFQVVEIDGKRFAGAVRDTVLVPPGSTRGRRFRRQQSRLVGVPLPSAVPPRRRHVHDDPVCVMAVAWRSIWVFRDRAVCVRNAPVLGVGFPWISLEFLVRIQAYQWVTKDLARAFFRCASPLTFPSPRRALVVLVCGRAGVVMEEA